MIQTVGNYLQILGSAGGIIYLFAQFIHWFHDRYRIIIHKPKFSGKLLKIELENPSNQINSLTQLLAKLFLIYIIYQASLSYEKSNDRYIEWSNLYIKQFKPDPNGKIGTPQTGASRFSTSLEHPSR